MATLVLDQYAPGGCFKQLSDAAGSNTIYSQYAPGGPAEQLRMVINPMLVLDQHHPGGVVEQAVMAIASGGGGSAPAWVPVNAKIHIDFLGGTPQGRAWSNGAEVAIDTLLGSDPNTVNAWSVSNYDPAGLTTDGYGDLENVVGFIGEARAAVIDQATLVFLLKQVGDGVVSFPVFGLVSADGSDALEIDVGRNLGGSVYAAVMSSWNGEPEVLSPGGILNLFANGDLNKVATTITGIRFEGSFNGCVPLLYPITDAGRPSSNPLVAAFLDITPGGTAAAVILLQSITIYDPLPDTTGLSELSALT